MLEVRDEVAAAVAAGRPVVALESTLLAQGLPAPRNREVAARLERAVRDAGAVPATIAVLDGVARVGLAGAELDRVCDPAAGLVKLSRRDLGPAMATGASGATTVAGSVALAHAAGIGVFATGGLGGVHRDTVWDVSADLGVLADTPVLVVCSGAKSVLDLPATLEQLETRSVPVFGYRTDRFPAFYLRDSGLEVPWRAEGPEEVAAAVLAHRRVASNGSGVLLANPVPVEHEMDRQLHDRLLVEGEELVRRRGVRGKDVTPALLAYFHERSGGASLAANTALVLGNAQLAAEVAVELARGRRAK
ncbi:pseudouridine-5'-phosphate glycosidase [Longimycelium tulufanense]|uniref:Pseudouridine-5'-phosphate glycosidase n=1 Tax=Longimycelium tulufanense TaxID=907463 RepID=A0A8J3CBI9_9PSEU|nr:pseudouridine-5'-phosphate glycosidase [Longimycelium tulufanense]GGM54854.1 pseudouridine-5'-phosphate glycosidase [Longimycelium tulufanense]